MIQAVTFDFWQTLVADTPENLARATALRIDGVRAVLEREGHPVEREVVAVAYEATGERLAATVWGEHRDLSCQEQVATFLDAIAPGLSTKISGEAFDEAVRAYINPVLSHPPLPFAGAIEAVVVLAARGVTLGIVSNTGRTPGVILRRVLARFGILDPFHVITFSDEVRVRKPRPEIFRLTLARAGVEPDRAVHIGDTPEADVAGARAAGMRAIHFAPDGGPGSEGADLVLQHFRDLPEAITRLV
jgi:putative hydrolase of the HAD superfamily